MGRFQINYKLRKRVTRLQRAGGAGVSSSASQRRPGPDFSKFPTPVPGPTPTPLPFGTRWDDSRAWYDELTWNESQFQGTWSDYSSYWRDFLIWSET
jgi:hypothetical protein